MSSEDLAPSVGDTSDYFARRDEVVASMRLVHEVRDWPRLAALIGVHWSLLFDEEPALLDEMLRDVPAAVIQRDPAAAAVRDIRLHVRADVVDRMLGAAALPAPDDLRTLGRISRSDRALPLLSVTAGRMIALRVRGFMTRAVNLATLVERIGRLAVVHRPALIQPRLPSALLQAGITRGLADDLPGAVDVLQDAYERAPMSRAQHVASDAAGKLALFLALAGDIGRARQWFIRYQEQEVVQGWHRPRVELTADVAHALIAIESLDASEAETVLPLLEQRMTSEQSWGPAVTYARARHALAWGDRLGALDMLRRDRNRYAGWLRKGSTFGPLLAQVESDLRLSLGQVRQAQLALGEHGEHALGRVAEARALLVAGQALHARRLAAESVAGSHSTRARVDALAVQTLAHLRLGEREAAVTTYEHMDAAVSAGDLHLIGHTVGAAARHALGKSVGDAARAKWASIPHDSETVQLTEQQQLVLRGLSEGRDFKAIAKSAFLSYNTVKTHARALYRRLDASSREEALARAYELGLL